MKTHLSDKPIEPEMINEILNAARMAPSARNTQPWRFVVAQDKEAIEKLAETAFFGPSAVVKYAAAIIIICARPEDDVTHEGQPYYLFDCGLAAANLLLAATDKGLATHLIASFSETEVKRILNIPDDVRVVITTPLAWPVGASCDEAARERLRQRARKEINEIVYYNKWGEQAPL